MLKKDVWRSMYSTNQFLESLYNKLQPEKKLADLNKEEFEKEKSIRIQKLKELFKLDELKEKIGIKKTV